MRQPRNPDATRLHQKIARKAFWCMHLVQRPLKIGCHPRIDPEHSCPSVSSPNRSSTASPPAKWSSVLRAWSRNWWKTPSTPAPAGSTFSPTAAAGGGSALPTMASGMTYGDLALAVDRHATSKLDDEDLLRIRTLGFRGEALPSIGAVAKLGITTRHASSRMPGRCRSKPARNPASCRRRCLKAPASKSAICFMRRRRG